MQHKLNLPFYFNKFFIIIAPSIPICKFRPPNQRLFFAAQPGQLPQPPPHITVPLLLAILCCRHKLRQIRAEPPNTNTATTKVPIKTPP